MTEPTASDLVAEHCRLDDYVTAESKRFQAHLKPAQDRMAEIKNKLHEMLLGLGSKAKQSISTDHGTVYTSTIMTPKISTWGPPYVTASGTRVGRDAYLDFCLDNWDTVGNEMLQLGAPQKDALKTYIEAHNGAVPPGIEISSFTRVNIRRS